MSEFTVSIPIAEYDRLRLCEVISKDNYINRLIKLSKAYAETDIEVRTNEDFMHKVKKQNELVSFLNSECFELKKEKALSRYLTFDQIYDSIRGFIDDGTNIKNTIKIDLGFK